MPLTTPQLQALRADALADPTLAPLFQAGGSDNFLAVRTAYNLPASPAWFVYRSALPVEVILNALNYTNFTPNDDPNQATATAAQVWENRAMLVQIKQMNLQLLLQGRSVFDATKPNLRAGLEDATASLPTGNNGNARSGGWTNIQPVLSRAATRAQKLFSTGTGTAAVPATCAENIPEWFLLGTTDVEAAFHLPA